MPLKPNLWPAARVLLALAAALAAAAAAQPPQRLQPPQVPETSQTFTGQLVVREREIVVDLPDNVSGKALRPGDFQVLVDGQPREVTRAAPVSREGPAPWTFLIYVDRVLASPGTAFYSELALAEHAGDLARLGTVEVTVARSDPGTRLSPTREARKIGQTLAGLAGADRLERDRERGAEPQPPSDVQVRRQLDKLLAFVASRRPSGPRVLFLVADGADLATEARSAAFHRAADLLAARGWIAVPMAVRPDNPGAPVAPRAEIDLFREGAGPSGHTISPPPVFHAHGQKRSALAYPRVIDLFTDPKMATLHVLSSTTAGAMIGYGVQLPGLLAELPRRWMISIAEPDSPVEGRLHTLAVRLPGRKTEARAPAWLP
jgi:hypothetical protein